MIATTIISTKPITPQPLSPFGGGGAGCVGVESPMTLLTSYGLNVVELFLSETTELGSLSSVPAVSAPSGSVSPFSWAMRYQRSPSPQIRVAMIRSVSSDCTMTDGAVDPGY